MDAAQHFNGHIKADGPMLHVEGDAVPALNGVQLAGRGAGHRHIAVQHITAGPPNGLDRAVWGHCEAVANAPLSRKALGVRTA